MALDPLSVWTSTIAALPPVPAAPAGFLNLANAIAGLMAKVQAGSMGTPGILTFDSATFAAGLSSLVPSASTAWASTMASAWGTALGTSVITPGTVTNPAAWTASTVDVNTLPAGAATLGPSIVSAQATVLSELEAWAALMADPTTPPSILMQGPMRTAQAFRDGTLGLSFICIGLAIAVPTPIPVPLTFTAE